MKKLVNLLISFSSVFLVALILMVNSCQKEEKAAATSDGVSGAASAVTPKAADIDFDKKKDEACDTEEDLEKQIEEAKKKQEAFKLQGGDGGCTTD